MSGITVTLPILKGATNTDSSRERSLQKLGTVLPPIQFSGDNRWTATMHRADPKKKNSRDELTLTFKHPYASQRTIYIALDEFILPGGQVKNKEFERKIRQRIQEVIKEERHKLNEVVVEYGKTLESISGSNYL